MLHQLFALTALRHADFNLASGFCGECVGEQYALLKLVRNENEPRRGLVVIELRQKRTQYFFCPDRAVSFWEVSAVTPVLPRAEEKGLDPRIAAGLMHGKDVGLFEATGINPLLRLDGQPLSQTVAINRRRLKIECSGRLV